MIRKRKFDLSLARLKLVRRSIPVPTIDFVAVRQKGKRREFLLGKRTDKPYKNKWFVTGGRIFKGETLERALFRQCKREIGAVPKKFRFVGCLTIFNPPDNFDIRWHAITHIYIVYIGKQILRKTMDNSSVEWFQKINPRWPKPTREMLERIGFKE